MHNSPVVKKRDYGLVNGVNYNWRMPGNIRHSLSLNLPEIVRLPENDATLWLCGGSPSLKDNIHRLEFKNSMVMSVNGAHDYLINNGVVPDVCVLLDSAEHLKDQITPHPDVKYFVASACDPSLFEHLKDNDIYLWHSFNDCGFETQFNIPLWVLGGCTVTTRAMCIGEILGFRKMRLIGVDSSFSDQSHAYAHGTHGLPKKNKMIASYMGRDFTSQHHMIQQAIDYIFLKEKPLAHCDVKAYGDGLIPYIDEKWPEKDEITWQ